MNLLSEGTFHFRRELRPFDIRQRPFRGGVKIQFRLPREHDLEDLLVVAEQPGYFGYAEVPSRQFHCVNEETLEYELNAYIRSATELRLSIFKRKPGALPPPPPPPALPSSKAEAKRFSLAKAPPPSPPPAPPGKDHPDNVSSSTVAPGNDSSAGGSSRAGSGSDPSEGGKGGANELDPNKSVIPTGADPGSSPIEGTSKNPFSPANSDGGRSASQQRGSSTSVEQGPPVSPSRGGDQSPPSSAGASPQTGGGRAAAQSSGRGSRTSDALATTGAQQGGLSRKQDGTYEEEDPTLAPPALEPTELQTSMCTRTGEPSNIFIGYPLERPQVPRIRRWWGFLNKVSVR